MRTDEKLQELCDRLASNAGDIHEAARWCAMSPQFVFQWIKDDKVAAERIEEAKRVGYMGLESEAIRRAVRGVEEDVYYKGDVVGTKIVYSDGLLAKVMEARIPEYKKGEGAGGNTFNGPTQINLMPRAESYEQWLGMRDMTLARRADEQLEAPKDIVPLALTGDFVEYEEVPADDERPLAALADLL